MFSDDFSDRIIVRKLVIQGSKKEIQKEIWKHFEASEEGSPISKMVWADAESICRSVIALGASPEISP